MGDVAQFPSPIGMRARVGKIVGTVTDFDPPNVTVRFNTYHRDEYPLDEVEILDGGTP